MMFFKIFIWPEILLQADLRKRVDDSETNLITLPDATTATWEPSIYGIVTKPEERASHNVLLQYLCQGHKECNRRDRNSGDSCSRGSIHALSDEVKSSTFDGDKKRHSGPLWEKCLVIER